MSTAWLTSAGRRYTVSSTKQLTLGTEMTDSLSQVFAALADPTRRDLVARLTDGDATVGQLAAPYGVSVQAISKHLKVLERAGLIVRGQHAQYRPCSLDPAPLEEVSTWAEQYRPVWEARFDRMDDYLTQLRSQRKTGEHDD